MKAKGSKASEENLHNGPLIRRKQEKISVQVGLDFGTSTTKAVYRQIGGKKSKAINFKHGLHNYPDYCLPSLAAIGDNGDVLLGIAAAKHLAMDSWDSGLQRLKVIVAGDCDETFKDSITKAQYDAYCKRCGLVTSFAPEKITAIYLAYAMHIARQHIQSEEEYGNLDLDLIF
ncbi:MAG: hypothetical protein LLG04_07215, partial [Parachlamydia sp.]|nr:hypothetical protein [Parachlamydia sp.]